MNFATDVGSSVPCIGVEMTVEMSEHDVQKIAAGLLRRAGVRFFAVPNGGLRAKHTALKLWQEGVQRGVPDLVIIDRPVGQEVGTVVEVKRAKGGVVSPEQRQWLEAFSRLGWRAEIACGLADLLRILCECGYLNEADCAPFKPLLSAAAGDGSTSLSPTRVRRSRTAPAPAAPTAAPPPPPKRGMGGAA